MSQKTQQKYIFLPSTLASHRGRRKFPELSARKLSVQLRKLWYWSDPMPTDFIYANLSSPMLMRTTLLIAPVPTVKVDRFSGVEKPKRRVSML